MVSQKLIVQCNIGCVKIVYQPAPSPV